MQARHLNNPTAGSPFPYVQTNQNSTRFTDWATICLPGLPLLPSSCFVQLPWSNNCHPSTTTLQHPQTHRSPSLQCYSNRAVNHPSSWTQPARRTRQPSMATQWEGHACALAARLDCVGTARTCRERSSSTAADTPSCIVQACLRVRAHPCLSRPQPGSRPCCPPLVADSAHPHCNWNTHMASASQGPHALPLHRASMAHSGHRQHQHPFENAGILRRGGPSF